MIGLNNIERDFVMLKIPISRIKQHQIIYPDLKEKMAGLNAVKKYHAFLMMLPYQTTGLLTNDKIQEILKEVKLL